jgi:hypothetical protein
MLLLVAPALLALYTRSFSIIDHFLPGHMASLHSYAGHLEIELLNYSPSHPHHNFYRSRLHHAERLPSDGTTWDTVHRQRHSSRWMWDGFYGALGHVPVHGTDILKTQRTLAGFRIASGTRSTSIPATTWSSLTFPTWVAAALFASPLLLPLVRTISHRQRTSLTLCPNCTYDLRAHGPGGKCPECGTPVRLAIYQKGLTRLPPHP